jgi:hypothetical protein
LTEWRFKGIYNFLPIRKEWKKDLVSALMVYFGVINETIQITAAGNNQRKAVETLNNMKQFRITIVV